MARVRLAVGRSGGPAPSTPTVTANSRGNRRYVRHSCWLAWLAVARRS